MMRRVLNRLPGGFNSIVFLLVIGGGLILHLYTQNVIEKLREESRSFVLFYARMYARAAETESVDDLNFIFDKIILKTHFPIIYTDVEGRPMMWKGIGVPENDRSDEAISRVTGIVSSLAKEFDPVPIRYQDMVLGKLYYGDSQLIGKLRLLPYVEGGIVAIFIIVGFIGYATIKRSEQRNIWVGMAKETAHQLGTPISSLMGWVELLSAEGMGENHELLGEINKDVERLNQVAKRFSQIGSKPNLKEHNVAGLVHDTVEYLRRRLPHLGKSIEINEHYTEKPSVKITPELFQWALENLIKNSLDAMDKKECIVEVSLMCNAARDMVIIDVKDNGKGMDMNQRRNIFSPGFSTKKRGWGLGLTLSKRIIEEYHGGRLFVKETRPASGTTMRIELHR